MDSPEALPRPIRFRDSWLIRIGAGLFLLGTGPLWIAILAYSLGWMTDNNPIGLGLLAFVTFWPSVILIAIGVVSVIVKRRRS